MNVTFSTALSILLKLCLTMFMSLQLDYKLLECKVAILFNSTYILGPGSASESSETFFLNTLLDAHSTHSLCCVSSTNLTYFNKSNEDNR